MVASNHLSPGMTISIKDKLFRVESCVKVSVPQGTPFMKAKLRDLTSNDLIERNFKLNQEIEDVSLNERKLEFLYLEDRDYLFLDIGNLEQVLIPPNVIGVKVNFLKEGVEVRAAFYGNTIFSIELPQFLELMVANTEQKSGNRIAILETGAKIEVPLFIEVGDIIKVDTRTDEYVQRV